MFGTSSFGTGNFGTPGYAPPPNATVVLGNGGALAAVGAAPTMFWGTVSSLGVGRAAATGAAPSISSSSTAALGAGGLAWQGAVPAQVFVGEIVAAAPAQLVSAGAPPKIIANANVALPAAVSLMLSPVAIASSASSTAAPPLAPLALVGEKPLIVSSSRRRHGALIRTLRH